MSVPPGDGATLAELLERARGLAIVPISNFRVGAIADGKSGRRHLGCNVEFRGLPLGASIHAEQAAVLSAWLAGESAIRSIAVTAAPCGLCRQFLMELGDVNLRVEVQGQPATTLAALLPAAFGPADLGVPGGLLRPAAHGLRLAGEPPADAALVGAALTAANACYAPYTGAFAGVALRLDGGSSVAGRYAESAAFNPSVGPLEAALTALAIRGIGFGRIEAAALVETGAPVARRGATEALLGVVAPQASMYYARAVAG